jgi:glycosyltransferase involved in cell wall biosynthesis
VSIERSKTVPISAVLITRDAEEHLEQVLSALGDVDEIVVLDSGSTDRTRAIAEAFHAVWEEHSFESYGPQKNRALALAGHDWVISVDADEVLDDEAREALSRIAWEEQSPGECWKIRRRPFVGATEIRHGHWVPDHVVRIFNRTVHRFTPAVVHERVVPTGPVRTLPGSMLHYSYRDLAALFRSDYHRLKAQAYRQRGRRAGSALLAARAALSFGRSYLLRRGFLDGRAGLVIALAAAVNAVLGLAMASEGGDQPRLR